MIDAINRTLKRKFGIEDPAMDTPCHLCGERYSDHHGTLCPPKLESDPEATYRLYASAPRVLKALEDLVTALNRYGIPEYVSQEYADAEKVLAQVRGIVTEV